MNCTVNLQLDLLHQDLEEIKPWSEQNPSHPSRAHPIARSIHRRLRRRSAMSSSSGQERACTGEAQGTEGSGTASGEFKRMPSQFRQCVTRDGSSGFAAEPNRYHLYVSFACPWAQRTLMYVYVRLLYCTTSALRPRVRAREDHPDPPHTTTTSTQ